MIMDFILKPAIIWSETAKFIIIQAMAENSIMAILSNVSNNNIARNNIFYNNSTSGAWSCGLLLSSGNGNAAYNNVAYGNFAGFCIHTRVTNARLYNNIAMKTTIMECMLAITLQVDLRWKITPSITMAPMGFLWAMGPRPPPSKIMSPMPIQ